MCRRRKPNRVEARRPWCRSNGLEARREAELVHPPTPRPVERMGGAELRYRETEHVDAQGYTRTANRLSRTAEELGRLRARPRDPGVRKRRHLHGYRPIRTAGLTEET